ncbi:hypothetical protein QBC38DRAFT_121259 [Podospora fimiseda]|uniref:Nucleoside-diphosphate-sugar epimerase n=1 Tax=Podospora fimiseda TaxID=252190 RepID=A0AAN7BFJ3_9PEZI|nr:hypothetical protein QBC38DRAFT_121259 [Podospora fimiseda]
MHLILTGATGLVGSAVLNAMIKTPEISKISILSRRPVQQAEDSKDPRINVIIHKDFTQYDSEVLSKLQGADGCVWALGISQAEVNKEGYIAITKEYPLKFAQAVTSTSLSRPLNFIYVSGMGVTHNPGRFTAIFAKVKGEAEIGLDEIRAKNPDFKTESIRPAFVDWLDQPEIKPYLGKSIGLVKTGLGNVMQPFIKYGAKTSMWSPTEMLGWYSVGLAMGKWEDELKKADKKDVEVLPGGTRIIENPWMWKIMGGN